MSCLSITSPEPTPASCVLLISQTQTSPALLPTILTARTVYRIQWSPRALIKISRMITVARGRYLARMGLACLTKWHHTLLRGSLIPTALWLVTS